MIHFFRYLCTRKITHSYTNQSECLSVCIRIVKKKLIIDETI
jgi:hypothetical protein